MVTSPNSLSAVGTESTVIPKQKEREMVNSTIADGTACQERKPSNTTTAVRNLEMSVSGLGDAVSKIAVRLESVMMPENPTCQKEPKEPSAVCGLAREIKDQVEKIDGIVRSVCSLEERLDV